ncbi:MAG: MSMEG_4193 family putative phosphomutase [Chloroflexi bacterium]|nr:MSMEG_4193 family putative phosphomutase [Chloroflexota bacterium]
MTRLLLIRHATNDLQKDGVLAGWTPGVHLSQAGRAQAEALAQRLATVEIKAFYASPLERTQETAEIVAAPHELPVVTRDGLGEVRFGRWTGESLDKLRRRKLWRAVQFAPSGARFPGGESFYEMQTRIVTELEALRGKHPKQTIAAVSHADVIKAAVAHYAGVHLDLFQRLIISPASLTVLMLEGPMPRLICMNDTGHLRSVVEGEKK